MNMNDIYWVAGFLEGEGCFGFYPKKGAESGRLVVCAVQVQKEPLDKLQEILGGKVYQYKKAKGNQQAAYSWQLDNSAAAGLMMTLFTLLSSRRQESIRQALKEWRKRPPDPKYKPYCKHGHLLSGKNVHITKQGYRHCRACKRIISNRWHANKVKKLKGVA